MYKTAYKRLKSKNGIKKGSIVSFIGPNATGVIEDTVREVFVQHSLLEPYARNELRAALVLTNHSWIFVDDVLGVRHENQ